MSAHVPDVKKTGRLTYTHLVLLVATFLISSCSHHEQPSSPTSQDASSRSLFGVVADTVKGSVVGAFEAAQSPLEDIGLKRQSIPDQLKKLEGNPYSLPVPANCTTVTAEISSLDVALGPERINGGYDNGSLTAAWNNMHNISWQDKDHYIDQGSSLAQQKAADEVRSHVTIIPYRSWLRWISGADAHAKKVAAAYEAGKLHRAFLRGVEANLHCSLDLQKTAEPVEVKKRTPGIEETALNDGNEKP